MLSGYIDEFLPDLSDPVYVLGPRTRTVSELQVDVMEIQALHLTSPETHYIFLGDHGERYCEPVLGSVEVTVPSSNIGLSGYPNINVGLARTITSARRRPDTPRRSNGGLLQKLQKRRSARDNTPSIIEEGSSADSEMLMQCHLWHIPDEIQHNHHNNTAKLKFNFALPIPHKTPPTIETMLGTVSYAISATLTSTCGEKTTSQPIHILRRAIPDYCRTIHHSRSFSDEQFAVSLDLIPNKSPGSDMKASYTAKLSTQRTMIPGPRETEMRHVVIKELKWRVEETVRVLSIPTHGGVQDAEWKEERVRQLCDGSQTGHWSVSKTLRKGQAKNNTIEVPFHIAIPRNANVAEKIGTSAYNSDTKQSRQRDISPGCYSNNPTLPKTTALFVTHRLRLDIIAGADTVDQVTGRLVDRQSLWKLFGASFSLPINEFASPEEVPDAAYFANDIPPLYEPGIQPPSYEA